MNTDTQMRVVLGGGAGRDADCGREAGPGPLQSADPGRVRPAGRPFDAPLPAGNLFASTSWR